MSCTPNHIDNTGGAARTFGVCYRCGHEWWGSHICGSGGAKVIPQTFIGGVWPHWDATMKFAMMEWLLAEARWWAEGLRDGWDRDLTRWAPTKSKMTIALPWERP